MKKQRRRRHLGRKAPPVLAALDLGTNNCRLLIASPGREGSFRIIDSFSRIVKLGEGVAHSGQLSEAAMDRTIAALKVCAQRIERHGARFVRAVATEACRAASNAGVLVERAAKEAGITLSVISAAEEARLAALGCAPLIGAHYEGALVFDIGGGSTETIWLGRDHGKPLIIHFDSVPLGVMTLSEGAAMAGTPMDYQTMRRDMRNRFEAVKRDMDLKGGFFDTTRHHLLGTSGTVTTLAGVALKLQRYLRSRVDASWHDCNAIQGVVEELAAMDRPARAAQGCVGNERADLIVPGCAIFSAIHDVWPCARLRVADRGLREGILRELMAEARR
ncbi:Ppx/GppA phosphatase family protein [Rhizomicrobium palustre]|uniref:Ppx/GppA phosphatase family protein n=1 Tax=Rhizomicrobium palustre TaxID=189966 RepID=UPI0031E0BED8